jgi:hypothetical protein
MTCCDVVTAAVVPDAAAMLTAIPSLSSLSSLLFPLFPSFPSQAIVSDAEATLIAPSPDAAARPTAALSEDYGELGGKDGSKDVIAI